MLSDLHVDQLHLYFEMDSPKNKNKSKNKKNKIQFESEDVIFIKSKTMNYKKPEITTTITK